VIASVIVVLDEARDLGFEITGQIVVRPALILPWVWGWHGAPRTGRLPDKQKDKLAVFRGEPSTFSTAYSKADYVRNEIWSARKPVSNMAEGIDGPVRRDLHVPPTPLCAGPPPSTPAHLTA
jgi:hypothetical protein